jgi:hypothetical protein
VYCAKRTGQAGQFAARKAFSASIWLLISDRYEIGQTLSRSGAGRDDVVVTVTRCRQCLGLVPMEPQTRSKEPRGIGQNRTARREFAERRTRLIGRVQLQDGFRPQLAFSEPRAYEFVDPRIEDVDKALDVIPVFLDHVLAKAENVKGHRSFGSQRPLRETGR